MGGVGTDLRWGRGWVIGGFTEEGTQLSLKRGRGGVLRGRRCRTASWAWDLEGEDLWSPEQWSTEMSVLIPWKP